MPDRPSTKREQKNKMPSVIEPKTSGSQPVATTAKAASSSKSGGGRKRKSEEAVTAPPAPPAETAAPPEPAAKKPRKKKAQTTSSEVSEVTPSEVSTVVSTASGKTKRNKKAKDKKQTTRTPSSYVLFSMMHRKVVIEANPDLTLGEVSKACGLAWKSLTQVDRDPWLAKAEELKKQRLAEIAENSQNDPPKRKRTPSSYLLFAMEHRKHVVQKNPNMSIGEVSKTCGAAWKELNEEDKKIWKDKAASLKE